MWVTLRASTLGFKIDHILAPKGRHIRLDLSPTTGLKTGAVSYPGLTPWAILCRHFVARSTFTIACQRMEPRYSRYRTAQ